MLKKKIRGCLLGGAAGDALGYEVEFMSLYAIRMRCGEAGVRAYLTDPALISDDTQMTLFTASGVLLAQKDGLRRPLHSYVYECYLDWLATQTGEKRKPVTQLYGVEALHSCRAPGNTCMSALMSGRCGCVEEPINRSKGCGGVMRVAPLALAMGAKMERSALIREGAQIAAITHGHALGYLPAALLTALLAECLHGHCATLQNALDNALAQTAQAMPGEPMLATLEALVRKAAELARTGGKDTENIATLGQGWVGEEALAIAIYCALRYADDFSACLTAAVTHSGDSDSTGAIAGNILGAWLGEDAIGRQWRDTLELRNVVERMADELAAVG